MIKRFVRYTSITLILFVFVISTTDARQSEQAGELIPLYTGEILGDFNRPITTSSERAQAYFDQGMQLRYSFAVPEAVDSFLEAQRLDPDCAMCYWGEAWARGPNLNSPGWGTRENALEAVQTALELAEDHTTPIERALIEALSTRYDESSVFEEEYAEAMHTVYEAFPEDPDVGTLFGEALFLLEPRRGSRDINDPNVRLIHQIFEGVLQNDIRHPGACHLYVHATESTSQPEKADPCAEYLADSVPGVSHMNHMPAHIWSQTGRYGNAVRVSLQSVETDRKAATGEGFAVYPPHNLHMLIMVATMDGQGSVAIQAGADYAEMTSNNMYHVMTLLRFGRFDEILSVEERPDDPIGAGMWDFAQGYARLRTGDMSAARDYLDRVLESAAETQASFRVHSAEDLHGILGGILEGEIHLSAGNPDAAIASFTRAVAIEDELTWDEPKPLPLTARHWLGAALLETGQPAEAERVYREDLDNHHPNNGWSLFGLKQALEAQGKPAAEVTEAFERSWIRSDTELSASRF